MSVVKLQALSRPDGKFASTWFDENVALGRPALRLQQRPA
jgi:hypothetical protein